MSVGASLGLAVRSTALPGVSELLREADRQLYRAKALGRGRSCVDGAALQAVA